MNEFMGPHRIVNPNHRARWQGVHGELEPLTWAIDLGPAERADQLKKDAAMCKLCVDCDMKPGEFSAYDPKVPESSAIWWWLTGTNGHLLLCALVHPKHGAGVVS